MTGTAGGRTGGVEIAKPAKGSTGGIAAAAGIGKGARHIGHCRMPCAMRPSMQGWWNHFPQHPGEKSATPPLAWADAKQIEQVLEEFII